MITYNIYLLLSASADEKPITVDHYFQSCRSLKFIELSQSIMLIVKVILRTDMNESSDEKIVMTEP